jgi:nucleotide-binding universal stress UspA family protein
VPVLVAVNHTAGDALLDAAAECARALDAHLLLLHVVPRPNARRLASARAYLDTLVAHLAGQGIEAEPLVRGGSVVAVILEVARREWVSAIVLGVSRRPALLRAVVGSISSDIERAAPCPVLLVEREPSSETEPGLRSFRDAAQRSGAVVRRLPRFETVEVTQIVGSVGRANELAHDFRPTRGRRRRQDEQRLERICSALEAGRGLPPLELYKLGSGYYVLDGHHRVAAALLLGQTQVDARVVEYVPAHRLN